MTRLLKAVTYVLLLLGLLSVMVPVGWALVASVKENSEFYGNPWALPKGVHLQNFIDAFETARMGEYFLNSVIVTALAIGILLAAALPCAYCLSRFSFRGRRLLNTLMMGGLFINVNYIVVPIFLMLVDGDKLLRQWTGNGFLLNNLLVLALVYAATAIPFTVYLLSSYFKTLPRDFEEAAYIDGSSHTRTMISIMFPMARPSIVTVILFNFLLFWNEYIIALTLLPGAKAPKTLPVGLLNLMTAQRAAAKYGQMYAGLTLVMLPTLMLYILVQKKLTQGMTLGGIKG